MLSLKILSFFILPFSHISSQGYCTYNAIYFDQNCYVWDNGEFGVGDEDFSCELGAGAGPMHPGHVTSVLNAYENQFLWNYANSTKSGVVGYLIGAFLPQRNTTNQWQWYDGNNMSYTNWAPGEPKTFQTCVSGADKANAWVNITNGLWYSATLADIPNNIGAFCKIPSSYDNIECPLSQWNDPNSGGIYYAITNKCYNAINQTALSFKQNITMNSRTCLETSNAWLDAVSIHSAEEANIVAQLLGNSYYCNFKGPNAYGTNYAFIGLMYNETTLKWGWIDGTPVNYTNWLPGYPKDPSTYGKCARLYSTSPGYNQWVNGDCSDYASGINYVICAGKSRI